MMDEKKMKDLNSFHSERNEFKEKIHQMIKEAKIEQLTNQRHKPINSEMTSEDAKYEQQLREKAKNLIAKAREGQLDKKSLKDKKPHNQIEEHPLPNLDTSLDNDDKYNYLSSLSKEKIFKSYRLKKLKDLPFLKKKLDSRLYDSWDASDKEFEDNDYQLNNFINKKNKSKSSPSKPYFANYELQDLENALEKIEREAYNLEIALRHAIDNDGDNDMKDYYLNKWFESINKRNAALHKEMQLILLNNEKDLNNRYELLNKELQALVSIEESQKTDAQKAKEKLLIEQLLDTVNKRSELVAHQDLEEQALKDDAYAMKLSENPNDIDYNQNDEVKNCSLM